MEHGPGGGTRTEEAGVGAFRDAVDPLRLLQASQRLGTFVPGDPALIFGLRGREKLEAGVRMLAERLPRNADADRKLVEPLEEERA